MKRAGDKRVRLPVIGSGVQPYGDLAAEIEPGVIRSALGATLLAHIVDEFLAHLGSSAAVYERDGAYALGIFASGWCRELDQASRALCDTEDNREALQSPAWHCHRSCWDISRAAMESGEPVDRPCLGGLRIYAQPIYDGENVIGAINFGHGQPPTDRAQLEELAGRYRLPRARLETLASSHEEVPAAVVDIARSRLGTAARLIGEIVARKRAEQEREALEAVVQRAQRLDSLGVLAGGVAHDFNNLLAGVLTNAELLADAVEDPAGRQCVADIERAALLARKLSRQMLTYAGRTSFQRQPVRLAEVVGETTSLLKAALGGIELALDVPDDLPAILGDAAGIQQIVMNLVQNAVEALDGPVGTVRVRAGRVPEGLAHAADLVLGELDAGPALFLEVEDCGRGIRRDHLERIFEPFFSTKGTSRGLGMAATLGIVRAHQGALAVSSTPGRGTRVRVLLPTGDEVAAAAPAPTFDASPSAGRCILLIDDEAMVRDVSAKLLGSHGYRVLTAASGAEGLAVFDQHHDTIAAVVVDRTMPQMSGAEVVTRLRTRRPDLPIVVISGSAADDLGEGASKLVFVAKPFRSIELLEGIERAMAGGRSVA